MGTTGRTSDTDRGGSVTSSSPSSIQDVIDKSTPLMQNINHIPPSAQDIENPSSPSRDIDQSTPLMQNVNHIPPSAQGAENPSPPSRDIDKSGTEAVSSVEYKVVTETGRKSDSGTASYVYLILHGVSDSEELYLNHKGPEMVPESVDTFRFSRSKDLGGIRKMEIQMKAYMGMKSNWFCVKLEVERRRQYTSYTVVEMYSSFLNQWLPREIGEDWMFETPRDIPFNLTKQFTHPN
ncbi:uncharacterized protein [Haliotis asinina]|uniref:uncharacterized protein n=1 Tax=Haliotis asinina TaxID=109174 RepID=UPI003531DC16